LIAAAGAFVALLFLAILLLPAGSLTWRMTFFLLVAAGLSGPAVVYWADLRVRIARRKIDRLLRSLAAGNLDAGMEAGTAETVSEYPGFQKLLRSFRNVIAYLQDTSENVVVASGRISEKTRKLMVDAGEQVESTEVGRASVQQLDEEIEKVVMSVDALSGFTEQTSVSILEMRSSIEEVVEATHELSVLTDENAVSIEEMSRSIEEVAGHADSLSSFAIQNSSAMVQMDATIGQIEENIRETEQVTRQVLLTSQEGTRVVGDTLKGLEKIHRAMATTLEAIDSLGGRSKQIGSILKVIRDIADQTNLLALNAAIIAAQAGEHGKSFGVVAEEIRDLAERASAATSEVGDLIQGVQQEVESVGRVARDGMSRAEEGLRIGKASEESLTRITQALSAAGTNVSHIARAASEQAKGSKQVTAAIEEMTRRIERISLATREQAQTSQLISKKTLNMQGLTRAVDNAMQDQAAGSNSIAEGMEQVKRSVESIQRALLAMSQAGQRMVNATDVIGGAAQQNLSSARDLSGTSNVLRQDSLLLVEELSTFSVPRPVRGGEILVAYTTHDYKLDPAYSGLLRDGEILFNIHEGLVKFGNGTRLMPGLAKEWHISADGRVYTFFLRPDAKFHHGHRVTAQDVVFSYERAMSPRLDNGGKWFLDWVEGVKEYLAGQAEHIQGLKALDEGTVEIRLREPLAFFLFMLTSHQADVIPMDCVDMDTLKYLRPIGAGPFRVAETTPTRVAMEAFRDYHQKGIPYADRLVFDYSAKNGDDLIEMLKHGGYHYAPGMSNESLEKLLQDPVWENQVETTVLLNTSVISIRNDDPLFSKKEVRQALNYAVDIESLVGNYSHTRPTPAKGVLPPGILAFDPSRKGYAYDPERARWLLARAGFAGGFEIKVPVDTSRVNQMRDFQAIIEMLARVGVRIEAEPISHEEFLALKKRQGPPALYATGWFADYPDPDNFLYVLFHSRGGDPLSLHYANPTLDDLVEKARRSLDLDERITLYRKAEDTVLDDAPCIFLYHSRGVVPHTPSVMGMKLSLTPPTVRTDTLWLTR
jgi:ABC-type transport system substrate-binding protein